MAQHFTVIATEKKKRSEGKTKNGNFARHIFRSRINHTQQLEPKFHSTPQPMKTKSLASSETSSKTDAATERYNWQTWILSKAAAYICFMSLWIILICPSQFILTASLWRQYFTTRLSMILLLQDTSSVQYIYHHSLVLRQVHLHFQGQNSFNFPWGYPVAAYVFFLVLSPLRSLPLFSLQ